MGAVCCAEEASQEVSFVASVPAGIKAPPEGEVTVVETYLSWRAYCLAGDWKPADRKKDLQQEVHDILVSPDFRKPPPFVTSEGPVMDLVHSRPMVQWYLERMKLVNSVNAPRMRVVWWGTLKKLGRLPRWPEDREHVLDAEAVLEQWAKRCDDRGGVIVEGSRREVCFSFFSHRWERPAKDAGSHYECGKAAHPDREDNKKARMLTTYGEKGGCPIFKDTLFDYYFYVDFACIDQDEPQSKLAGVTVLPMQVAVCIELIFFDSRVAEYEPRGWTRVERVFAYSYCFSPIIVYIGEEYPEKVTDFKALCDAKPDIYSMDESGNVYMVVADPLASDAALTNPADRSIVKQLCDAAMNVPPLNVALAQAMSSSTPGDQPAVTATPLRMGVDKVMLDTEHQKMDTMGLRGEA
eukprot:TRINITY_DN82541_c0_g1_i1.p1 TRINITY_DN82541_c0_g1~~TRINITY_DN82541_c0_g1_i1.p1  ORF type:complete len:447 (+),score=64.65 TRINITY_DN82541_c0_g1_i1:115-1341(+)